MEVAGIQEPADTYKYDFIGSPPLAKQIHSTCPRSTESGVSPGIWIWIWRSTISTRLADSQSLPENFTVAFGGRSADLFWTHHLRFVTRKASPTRTLSPAIWFIRMSVAKPHPLNSSLDTAGIISPNSNLMKFY